MITDDQRDIVAFFSGPAVHEAGAAVETIETHISRIFLAGERVWKTKRAVKLPYVDFSTAALRLAACEREVELNSFTAPELYVRAHRVTREPDGRIVLDGDGELVDGVVEMRRFDQACLLDRMAAAGRLTPHLMTETARGIERFHRLAPVSTAGGGAAGMAGVLDINEAGFAECRIFDAGELGSLHAAMRAALARHATLLDRRFDSGRVRRCHGDLHLRNICLLDGRPQLFDCIEFNDGIATVDVLYDLAFLLMDLWHRDLPDLANLVMNRYLDQADDEDGFELLPFFMAVRAAVRAHVMGTQLAESARDAEGGGVARDDPIVAEARSYFELATGLLAPVPPRLIAIGGLSGTGKTTVAETLAARVGAPPGARIVESDRIRKAMHGVAAETRLPKEAYRPEVSEEVYGEMVRRAGQILAQGGSVVTDAVFDGQAHRDAIGGVAADLSIPFAGIWLEAAPDVLRQRVADRRGGPSDATVDILARQLERKAPAVDWRVVDAARPAADVARDILAEAGVARAAR